MGTINRDLINKQLKRMWLIKEKIDEQQTLSAEEIHFYNTNLHFIQRYYKENADIWKQCKVLEVID